ncbi:MAG: hypothetical protein GF353_24955 [Candidatus Lokiarchaeota archaeon]|nr:hypothetical protein [Candidatus Lokiarchaeota archaeon]
MRCQVCGNEARVNYGDAYTVICRNCFDTDEANLLLEANRINKFKPKNFSNIFTKAFYISLIPTFLIFLILISFFYDILTTVQLTYYFLFITTLFITIPSTLIVKRRNDRLIKAVESKTDQLFNDGIKFFDQKLYAEAELKFKSALEIYENSEKIMYHLALTYLVLGKVKEGLALVGKIKEIDYRELVKQLKKFKNVVIFDNNFDKQISSASEIKWYLAENRKKRLRQIVFSISPKFIVQSKLGQLILSSKYVNLIEKGWATGLFRLNSDPGPFLLVRADGYVDCIKESSINLGISFHSMESGGLFGIYISVDSSDLRIRRANNACFEIAYGLDENNTIKLISDFIENDHLNLILADGDNLSSYNLIDVESASINQYKLPLCKYDITIPLDENCKKILKDEFEKLRQYHSGIPIYSKNFQLSLRELWDSMPEKENPILKTYGLQQNK